MLLRAAPLPREQIPALDTPAGVEFVRALVRDAFERVRAARAAPKKDLTRQVKYGAAPSREAGRLGACRWHTRVSEHGVPFETMRAGLLTDHTAHEREYIDALREATCIEALAPGVGIWHLAYATPWPTASRDFCELVAALPLPAHTEPFSPAHEAAALAGDLFTEPPPPPGAHRAFLVISQPVAVAAAPHAPGHVRAYYASVEAVCEAPGGIEWLMSVQTDSAGLVPHFVQELAMPRQIAADVSSYFEWTTRLQTK